MTVTSNFTGGLAGTIVVGGAEAMVQDFKTNVFPDRPVSFVKIGAKGKEVGVL